MSNVSAPNIPPYQAPPPPPAPGTVPTPQTVDPFAGTLPTAKPYGDFTAPEGMKQIAREALTDPSYQWRLSQGLKGLERGAASRGTLLTGGLQKGLIDYGQNAASQEYGNVYQRALASYGTNRDTNAQNFGQEHTRYLDDLSGHGENRASIGQNNEDALAAYRAAHAASNETYDRNAAASDKGQDWAAADATRRNDAENANATSFIEESLRREREQQAAAAAQNAQPKGKPYQPTPYLPYRAWY